MTLPGPPVPAYDRAPVQPTPARTVAEILDRLDIGETPGRVRPSRPFATGFDPLDRVLDGGLRPHDLALIGGMPGVGKTIVTLQWARNIAAQGRTAIYVCYEHDESDLMARLLSIELAEVAHVHNAPALDKLRIAIREVVSGYRRLDEVLDGTTLLAAARERMAAYADWLWLVRGSGRHTGVDELEHLLEEHGDRDTALFVDYLQKIAVRPEPPTEAEKVTHIAEQLKDLALNHDVAVVCVVAADRQGLESRRLRLHHLRGSSALAYESDVVILLNEKFQVVSKVHLAYDPVRAETFKRYAVFTIEKNRSGPALLDLEFEKNFSSFRFDPLGGYVAERLVDERLYTE